MELKSRDKLFNKDNLYIKNGVLDKVLNNNVIEFCDYINKIYIKERNINLYQAYRYLGRLEIISVISENQVYNLGTKRKQ